MKCMAQGEIFEFSILMFVQEQKNKKMCLKQRGRDVLGELSASHCRSAERSNCHLQISIGSQAGVFQRSSFQPQD